MMQFKEVISAEHISSSHRSVFSRGPLVREVVGSVYAGPMEEADGPQLQEEDGEHVLGEEDEVAPDGAGIEMHRLRYLALAGPPALQQKNRFPGFEFLTNMRQNKTRVGLNRNV
jgi:hypothetical protein